MKFHTIYFLVLKISFMIQFFLVSIGKESENSVPYLISDFVFKTSIGLFLILYFYFNHLPDLHGWDRVVISFGGVLLLFDAFYTVLPKVLLQFGVVFNPFSLGDLLKPLSKN